MSIEVPVFYPGIDPKGIDHVKHEDLVLHEVKADWLIPLLKAAPSTQQELANTPLKQRLKAISMLGEEWLEKLESGKLSRLKEELARATGYPLKLIDLEFDFVAEVLNQENLVRILDVSLTGGAESLERLVELAPGERVRTMPAGPVLIIGSGNSIIPPLIPTTLSIVTGNFTILRPSITNIKAVQEVYSPLQNLPNDDPLRRALIVGYYAHESRNLKTLLEKAPLGVVNYWGGEPGRTLVAHMLAVNPYRPRFIVNGPMTGFAIIDSEHVDQQTAERLALEMILYEQQLCNSPTQAALIGPRHEAIQFAEMLASALEKIGQEYSLQSETLPYALFVLIRSLELAGAKVLASTDPRNPWTIVVSENDSALAKLPKDALLPLHYRRRFIEIVAVQNTKEALALIEKLPKNPAYQGVDKVQTIAIALTPDKIAEIEKNLHRLGVYRVVPLGESYLRTPLEPYDGLHLPQAFTYTVYLRVR
ncbi:MAG: acyl-CoA reductase [Infirmifilum sp.]